MAEINLTVQNFEDEVINASKPVLVDFWAPWCGPCRMLSPVISEIAEEYAGQMKVAKVNVDEVPEMASQFRVASIPTLMVFENGKLTQRASGFRPKEDSLKLRNEQYRQDPVNTVPGIIRVVFFRKPELPPQQAPGRALP